MSSNLNLFTYNVAQKHNKFYSQNLIKQNKLANRNIANGENCKISKQLESISLEDSPKKGKNAGRASPDVTNLNKVWYSNKPDLIENTQNKDSNNEKEFEKVTPQHMLTFSNPSSPYHKSNIFESSEEQELNNEDGYFMENELKSPSPAKEDDSLEPNLPPGWERIEVDNDGTYYWHIKSGTIQREPPDLNAKNEPKTPLVKDIESMLQSFYEKEEKEKDKVKNKETEKQSDKRTDMDKRLSHPIIRSKTTLEIDQAHEKRKREELLLKRRSVPTNFFVDEEEKGIRFIVRSLGWVEMDESDLTPDRSSKAVNKCIVDLSTGRNDIMDNVARWGDGKELFMDLDIGSLKLIDPDNLRILNVQPIHTIRVWGVGRDNGRDFAYVARDRATRIHMCHVFRCDMPARTIANTLRDICKKLMIERSTNLNLAKQIDGNPRKNTGAVRPTNLPTERRKTRHRNGLPVFVQSFPTPMEEPKKILKALYVGSVEVFQASGIDLLNDAINQLVQEKPQSEWDTVNVAVAPSMITVSHLEDDRILTECRVRYLSFLGIGKNVKHCAFIVHTAQDQYICHVFHCEPSSGALCKTIEAACKLRYQKCLDAHPGHTQKNLSSNGGKGIGATLKSFVGSISLRKTKSTS